MTRKKLDIAEIRSLSRILSRSNLESIIFNKNARATKRSALKYLQNSEPDTYHEVLIKVYKELSNSYRNEYFYKNSLLNKLILKKYSLKDTVILDEFRIGKSIADLVLLNGEIRVFEVKTELDSLDKLGKQIDDYCRFTDSIYIVTCDKYISEITRNFPQVGIILLSDRNQLKTIRKPSFDKSHLEHKILFKALRKSEYLSLVDKCFSYIPDVPNTLIYKECLKLCETLSVQKFYNEVLLQLKKRQIGYPEGLFNPETPAELRHLCYTMDLNKNEYLSLYSFLNSTFK